MTGRCQCGAVGVIGIVSDQIGRRNYCRDHLGDALELVADLVDDERDADR